LQNILDNYTLSHANRFLQEIDKRELSDKIGRIHEFRIAQAETKSYKQIMGQLERQERQVNRVHQPQGRLPMTEDQRIWADQRTSHVKFDDLSDREKKQHEMAWATVPVHMVSKAKKLGGQ
jgi:hypothetical protein